MSETEGQLRSRVETLIENATRVEYPDGSSELVVPKCDLIAALTATSTLDEPCIGRPGCKATEHRLGCLLQPPYPKQERPLTRDDVETLASAVGDTMKAEFTAELERQMDAYDKQVTARMDAAMKAAYNAGYIAGRTEAD